MAACGSQHGFFASEHELGNISDMLRVLPNKEIITIEDDKPLGHAVRVFKAHGISQMPCTMNGRLSGIVTESDVLHFLVDGRDIETPLAEVMEQLLDCAVLQELLVCEVLNQRCSGG